MGTSANPNSRASEQTQAADCNAKSVGKPCWLYVLALRDALENERLVLAERVDVLLVLVLLAVETFGGPGLVSLC